jgi:hypothetical protein
MEIQFGAQNGWRKATASLDRIDSSKGYTIENVQWVHAIINNMKWDMPQSEFLSFCYAVCRKMETPANPSLKF